MRTKEIDETITDKAESKIEWTKEHDTYLKSLVGMYGVSDWHIVAECMNNKFNKAQRTGKQCKDRWRSYLDSNSGRQSWSDRERYMLLVAHQKHKNRWSEVAMMLKKQSSNMIKNRFYTLFRKIKNKIKNDDLIISTSLDLLEIYYILSLIEEYQALVPDAKSGPESQPDKNYAHKLVQQIEKTKVTAFKTKVIDTHKEHGGMPELFDKYAVIFGFKSEKTNSEDNMGEERLPETIPLQPAGGKEPICKNIELPESGEEFKIKITLPEPNNFSKTAAMTDEEKSAFWKIAFLSKEPLTKHELPKSANSVYTSLVSPPYSADESAMRDDEYCGFSQFATAFEGARPLRYGDHLSPPAYIGHHSRIPSPTPIKRYSPLPVSTLPPKLPPLPLLDWSGLHSPLPQGLELGNHSPLPQGNFLGSHSTYPHSPAVGGASQLPQFSAVGPMDQSAFERVNQTFSGNCYAVTTNEIPINAYYQQVNSTTSQGMQASWNNPSNNF